MSAAPPTDLAPMLQGAGADGGRVALDPTRRYHLDVNRLPALVHGLELDGQGAVVEVTDAPSRPGSVVFTDCTFENLVLTAPSITNPKVPVAGYACARNTFRGCTFLDYAPSIVWQHGRGLTFENNRVLASDHPPPRMYSNLYCPLGDLVVRGSEMNFPPVGPPGPATGILVGASGPPSAGQEFSDWKVQGNRFLDADRPGYTIDTILDLEAGQGSMHDIWFTGNTCFNGKVDCSTGDNIWITDNHWRVTRHSVGPQQGQSAILFIIATGASGIGSLHLERNVYVQDPDAPPAVKAQAILVTPQVRVGELVIRGNTFVVNGRGTPPVPAGVVGVHLKPNAPPGTVVEHLDLTGNSFGFTAAPAAPGPLIAINHPSPQPGVGIGTVEIRGNRVLAGPTAGLPPLASGRLLGQFLRLGFPGHVLDVASLEVTGNSVPPGSIVGQWFATPPTGVNVRQSRVEPSVPAGG